MSRWIIPIVLLLLLLAACSGGEEEIVPTATPVPPTPTPTPQDWLEAATERFRANESFHFTLVLEERLVAVDAAGLLQMAAAEGDVIVPDRMQAVAQIITPIGATELGFVAIGTDQYLTNPLNGQWEQAPPEMQTDLAVIFSDEGVSALLDEIDALERLPDETLDGVTTVRLRGRVPGSALALLAPELAEVERLTVDLWVDAASEQLLQIELTEPPDDEGQVPIWRFRLSDFDEVAAIEPPV